MIQFPFSRGLVRFPDPEITLDLPHNDEIEQALLAALLTDDAAYDAVCDILTAAHFYNAAHGRIYDAIKTVCDAGGTPSPDRLSPYFRDDPDLIPAGGAQYLFDLARNVVSVVNAADYAQEIYDLHLRRGLMSLSRDTLNDARLFDLNATARDCLEDAEQKLYDLAEVKKGEAARDMGDVAAETLSLIDRAQKGEATGLATGFRHLDKILGGLQKDDLIVLAARPGMGKTAFALNIAGNAAAAGVPVLFFSLEMGAAQLYMRLLARATGVPVQKQRAAGELSPEDVKSLIEHSNEIAKWPLFIDDSGRLSAAQIRSRVRRFKRRHGLGLVLIDYLGIMGLPDMYGNMAQQIGIVTAGLKAMAKEFHIPVVLLSQLNRAVEGRDDKRPTKADLRDSGNIEQDADIILFLYREEYYLNLTEPQQKAGESMEKFADKKAAWDAQLREAKGKADLIIGKFRQGQEGVVKLAFNGAKQAFHDIWEHGYE